MIDNLCIHTIDYGWKMGDWRLCGKVIIIIIIIGCCKSFVVMWWLGGFGKMKQWWLWERFEKWKGVNVVRCRTRFKNSTMGSCNMQCMNLSFIKTQ